MQKESRVMLTEEQHAQLTLASERAGMKLATYLRYWGLRAAEESGFSTIQPRAD